MKKTVTAFFILLLALHCRSQKFTGGYCLDFNSGLRTPNTIGVALDFQARIKNSNWYLNWHYVLGQTYEGGDLYGKSNICVLLYKDPDWWDTPGSSDAGSLLGALI